jgi:hypothetical protein
MRRLLASLILFVGSSALAQPAFIAVETATIDNTTGNLSVTLSAGDVTGSPNVVALAQLCGLGTSASIAPAGFNSVLNTNATGNAMTCQWYLNKTPTASTYTWTRNGTYTATLAVATYSGVNTGTVTTDTVEANNGVATASSTSHATNSITTTFANDLIVTGFGTAAAATWTAPGGETERWDLSASFGLGDAGNDEAQAIAGATGAKTATSSSAAVGVAQILALVPIQPTPTPAPPACCQVADGTGVGHPGSTCVDNTFLAGIAQPSIQAFGGCTAVGTALGTSVTFDGGSGGVNCAVPGSLASNCVAAASTDTPTRTPTITPTPTITKTPTKTPGTCAAKVPLSAQIVTLPNSSCRQSAQGPTSGTCSIYFVDSVTVMDCPGQSLKKLDTTTWP